MIRCIKFRAFQKNTLKGFADLELTRVGLVIRDCAFHEKDGKEWVGFPGRKYEQKGETKWQALIEFAEGAKEAREHRGDSCCGRCGGRMNVNLITLRHRLRIAGYSPIPCEGKKPKMDEWQKQLNVTPEEIKQWSGLFPYATNTGVLTRLVPTIDIDILNPEAAKAVELLVRERHEEHGSILTRFGKPPKRAIPFRTDEPFKKIKVDLTAPDGSEGQKIELLADGQQFIVAGIHPDTRKPYGWFDGNLDETPREDLPYIREDEARALVEAAAELLMRDFGYTRAAERPKDRPKANGHAREAGGDTDWQYLFSSIYNGHALHDSLRDLAAKLVASGTRAGAAVNQLRGLMKSSTAAQDERWSERYEDIPRLVESAIERNGAKHSKPATGKTARELRAMAFDPVRFLVRNLIPSEGVTIICAKPRWAKAGWCSISRSLAPWTGTPSAISSHCKGACFISRSKTAIAACGPASTNCCRLPHRNGHPLGRDPQSLGMNWRGGA
jgi:hypothetical protein